MSKILNVYYDTKFAPITFDFATYLVVADCYRQFNKIDYISLNIMFKNFRKRTERELIYNEDEMNWRVKHILLNVSHLLPSVKQIEYSKFNISSLKFPFFPPNYPPRRQDPPYVIPYLAKELFYFKDKNINIKPFHSTKQASYFISNIISSQKIITITLRSSSVQEERNSILEEWYKFYKFLISRDYKVLVIPDFEDFMTKKSFSKYDWEVFYPAIFDLDLRLALYENSHDNYIVSNGIAQILIHSNAPYKLFKPIVSTINQTTIEWYKDNLKINPGDNFWWANNNQYIFWDIDYFDNLINSFI